MPFIINGVLLVIVNIWIESGIILLPSITNG